jgi:nitrate/nitrite-specific signal transduction histidine kinase
MTDVLKECLESAENTDYGPEKAAWTRAANEIGRLREALKTFADNVRETNAGIDENWAKTVYPLKKENQRLREALQHIRSLATTPVRQIRLRSILEQCVWFINDALKEGE